MTKTLSREATRESQSLLRDALARLGIERLVLSVHQASFPASDDDLGHGAPYSKRAVDFARFAAGIGFNGLMLGPAGVVSPANDSPYDASIFSREVMSLSFARLVEEGLLDARALDRAVRERCAGERVDRPSARRAANELLARIDGGPFAERVARFRASSPWLGAEAEYESVAAAVGHDDWTRWPQAPPRDRVAGERFELGQLLAAEQHAEFRRAVNAMGLRVYADMQVGMGHRDRKLFGPLLLAGYALGAPPSRTNPEGQPWGYPLFDPTQLAPGGAARALFEQRLDLLLRDHDGLRVDHPHGLVCPWVYRTDLADPLRAVQAGARLHESPDLPDHPALRRYARVRPEQIDASVTRYDDRRVRWLEAPQIDAYATAFDLIVARARAHGVSARDLCAEVLSTCPVPLRAVLTRHGLGRFRVTQKARVDIPEDVYRSDNADAMDWVMVGNHDTDPLTLLTERWHATPEASRRAEYLARRLCPSERERAPMAVAIAQDTQAMAQAMFADLFVGPARQVLVFWADLFGVREVYNRPGVVHPDNWTLRVPRDFEHAYAQATRHGAAPSLPSALATALRARGLDHDDGRALTERLDALAHEP